MSDTSLTFDEHIKTITSDISKTIGLLRKLNNRSRSSLTAIYKSFVTPHLHYDDVIFDKVYNSFQQRYIYKVSVAITCAIQCSSTEKLSREAGLESLQNRRWFRKYFVFYKIVKGQSQKYLRNNKENKK